MPTTDGVDIHIFNPSGATDTTDTIILELLEVMICNCVGAHPAICLMYVSMYLSNRTAATGSNTLEPRNRCDAPIEAPALALVAICNHFRQHDWGKQGLRFTFTCVVNSNETVSLNVANWTFGLRFVKESILIMFWRYRCALKVMTNEVERPETRAQRSAHNTIL